MVPRRLAAQGRGTLRPQRTAGPARPPTRAFVLGAGGALGAYGVGMLKALFAAAMHPDLVVGTSVGATGDATVAVDPAQYSVARLAERRTGLGRAGVFSGSLLGRLGLGLRQRLGLAASHP
ncbi:patatin-like phospholipase family protein [Streptomyces sp. NPDC015220]|uniref:patatin-like phospholipase family protein n=1 Tax=Streptomyces sp. NPDC015220 TaxID=3364947 RepID=UPI0036F803D7